MVRHQGDMIRRLCAILNLPDLVRILKPPCNDAARNSTFPIGVSVVPAKPVMRIFPSAISVALLLAPPLVRGDATIRYKTEVTSAPPFPVTESTSIIYMKGN
jgi:hypothetical protein